MPIFNNYKSTLDQKMSFILIRNYSLIKIMSVIIMTHDQKHAMIDQEVISR